MGSSATPAISDCSSTRSDGLSHSDRGSAGSHFATSIARACSVSRIYRGAFRSRGAGCAESAKSRTRAAPVGLRRPVLSVAEASQLVSLGLFIVSYSTLALPRSASHGIHARLAVLQLRQYDVDAEDVGYTTARTERFPLSGRERSLDAKGGLRGSRKPRLRGLVKNVQGLSGETCLHWQEAPPLYAS